jgi:hypothetical protein
MNPILDETSLVPCALSAPGTRIVALSSVLARLDKLGVQRVLRSVTDAADRDIFEGRGLRNWCFDPGTNRDAGLLLAARLSRHPYIDGNDGLFSVAEGARVLETRAGNNVVLGLGLAALEGGVVAALASAASPAGRTVDVEIQDASGIELLISSVPVFSYVQGQEVDINAASIREQIDNELCDGSTLIQRFAEVYPFLRLGPNALDALRSLTGTEPVYRQILRHLNTLNTAVIAWRDGTNYLPEGIMFSVESGQTLSHGKYGPMRDFPPPEGFAQEKWSLHTKLTGGTGARMYFRPVWTADLKVVLIGYVGSHLPCVRYPT